MYQWVNPSTGRSQLSGKAPSWYRSEMGGPRVLVFEKNVLVDDTVVTVDEAQRLQLRGKALPTKFAKDQQVLSHEQAVAKLEDQIQAIVESPAMEEYLKSPPTENIAQITNETTQPQVATQPPTKATNAEMVAESADERVERLKALISAWDQNKTEKAKLLLESEKNSTDP